MEYIVLHIAHVRYLKFDKEVKKDVSFNFQDHQALIEGGPGELSEGHRHGLQRVDDQQCDKVHDTCFALEF